MHPSSDSQSPPRTNSHNLSSATPPTATRKSRSSEPNTTSGNVQRASLSMPPPAIPAVARQNPSPSTGASSESHSHDDRQKSKSSSSGSSDPDLTPKLEASQRMAASLPFMLPDAALRQIKPSDPETESNRMSFSSLYSFGSGIMNGVKGISGSGPSSVAGSEPDLRIDHPGAVPTTASSAIAVTTSTNHGTLGVSPQSIHSLETVSSNPSSAGGLATVHISDSSIQRSSASNRATQSPAPMRSRSRTRTSRRISGVTASTSAASTSESTERRKPTYGVIGVCALDTKARSKPSRNILNRLIANGDFSVTIFGDKIILDEDVENWPVCDFLVSFFSDGFPLEKAIAYERLRKPFCVNDLPMQTVLWDRRLCLRILDGFNVPTPQRIEVSRDGGPKLNSPELAMHMYERTGLRLPGPDDGTGGGVPAPKKVELSEDGDTLIVDGQKLTKPFVEKPVSGEDHNIHIYFSKSTGGGGRRLFRKVNNKSSERDEKLTIPRSITEPDESYVYEQFVPVDSAEDVKAYTVGPNFCHAETRKSPVVDGLVKRNPNGKEVRYVTSLTKEEAEMASRIVQAFGQRVCGFDLLRAGGKSYVIDVNGWSFVKDNNEYYDNCSTILRELFIREKQRQEGKVPPPLEPELATADKTKIHQPKPSGSHRATLKSIFKSPSVSKLAHTHILHRHEQASPDTLPISSPPSLENTVGLALPLPIPHSNLPPSAMSDVSSGSGKTPRSITPGPKSPVPPPASKAQWKLKGMVSVVRHADRTPKQKFKFTFHTKPFIDLLKGHQAEVLLIGEAALDSVLAAVELALVEGEEDTEKLKLLRTSLIKKGAWTGTKVQIKPMFRSRRKDASMTPLSEDGHAGGDYLGEQSYQHPLEAMENRSDSNQDVTLSRISAAEKNLVLDKLQLIIKWGGEPTHSARYQAQDLGENLRNDLLLMNPECLEEVSVFSSSERRVTTSAQIFAAAFLNDKDLPSEYIKVRKDLLDDSNAAKDEMDKVKKRLKQLLREGDAAPLEFAWPHGFPEPFIVVRRVVQLMKFHRRVMIHNFSKLQSQAASSLAAAIKSNPSEVKASGSGHTALAQAHTMATIQARWCSGEDADLFRERWEKLFKEFVDAEKVDPSKLSELYDTMKFDALHNRQFLEWVFTPDASLLEDDALSEDTSPEIAPQSKSIDTGDKLTSRRGSDSKKDAEKGHIKEPANFAHRMGFRHRSDAGRVVGSTASSTKSVETEPEDYFKLHSGGEGSPSKLKSDARLTNLRELYKLSKTLFDYIGPQEYGISPEEKLEIGLLTSLPLLKEIVRDLEEVQASDGAHSFFYFTKESHIYTLLNCIIEGGIKTKIERKNIPELDYLSQINFELYESQNAVADEEEGKERYNYSIRISISPGCHTFDPLDVELDSKHCIGCAPRRSLTAHGDWKEILETLRAKFHTVKLPKSFIAINLSEISPSIFGPVRKFSETGMGDDEPVSGLDETAVDSRADD